MLKSADMTVNQLKSFLPRGAGGVILGTGWPDAKVWVLSPLADVSEHAPVTEKLPL